MVMQVTRVARKSLAGIVGGDRGRAGGSPVAELRRGRIERHRGARVTQGRSMAVAAVSVAVAGAQFALLGYAASGQLTQPTMQLKTGTVR